METPISTTWFNCSEIAFLTLRGSGATYFFEGSSNLLTREVLGTTNATSSTVQFVDTNANGSQRYYRIREQRQ